MSKHYIIGIDEAGRGAWAWPVVAWGFLVEKHLSSTLSKTIPGIKDSKKLDRKKREDIFSTIEYLTHKNECQFAFAYRDAHIIDSIWIREANRECMEDIILSLMQFIEDSDTVEIWIDGCDNYTFAVEDFDYAFAKKKVRWKTINGEKGSHLDDKQLIGGSGGKHCLSDDENLETAEQSEKERVWFTPETFRTFGHESTEKPIDTLVMGSIWKPQLWKEKSSITFLINGDNLHPIISLWSIIAKVVRDRIMCEYNEDFPLYGFSDHVGYGTRKHQEALNNYNITSIHRKSYAPVKRLISLVSSI